MADENVSYATFDSNHAETSKRILLDYGNELCNVLLK